MPAIPASQIQSDPTHIVKFARHVQFTNDVCFLLSIFRLEHEIIAPKFTQLRQSYDETTNAGSSRKRTLAR